MGYVGHVFGVLSLVHNVEKIRLEGWGLDAATQDH